MGPPAQFTPATYLPNFVTLESKDCHLYSKGLPGLVLQVCVRAGCGCEGATVTGYQWMACSRSLQQTDFVLPCAGTAAVDIYGFGCVLWQILTGETSNSANTKRRLPRYASWPCCLSSHVLAALPTILTGVSLVRSSWHHAYLIQDSCCDPAYSVYSNPLAA